MPPCRHRPLGVSRAIPEKSSHIRHGGNVSVTTTRSVSQICVRLGGILMWSGRISRGWRRRDLSTGGVRAAKTFPSCADLMMCTNRPPAESAGGSERAAEEALHSCVRSRRAAAAAATAAHNCKVEANSCHRKWCRQPEDDRRVHLTASRYL